jgi:hypothetical protein
MLIFSEAREGEGMQKSLSYFWLVLNPRPSEQKTLPNSLFNYRGKKMFPVNITMTAHVRPMHTVIE